MTKETMKELETIALEEREVEGIYPEDSEPSDDETRPVKEEDES